MCAGDKAEQRQGKMTQNIYTPITGCVVKNSLNKLCVIKSFQCGALNQTLPLVGYRILVHSLFGNFFKLFIM